MKRALDAEALNDSAGACKCSWSWARCCMPVLQAANMQQEGIPYRELQEQLPKLMDNLKVRVLHGSGRNSVSATGILKCNSCVPQEITTSPMAGLQLRLMAKAEEAPRLEEVLNETSKELGFFWSFWSPDKAPADLKNVQVGCRAVPLCPLLFPILT